jgi:hypothetical protein
MFVCLDCGHVFDDAAQYTETHGFTDGLYETWKGCPKCGGAFVETRHCDNCGRYIVDTYIKTASSEFLCSNCYTEQDIEDGVR